MDWWSGLEAICRRDEPLSAHTWYGLGGPARFFLTPRDEDELADVLERCAAHRVPWHVLGCGANLLVRDAGVDGAVIHLRGPYWEAAQFDGPTVRARAGADFPKLVKRSAAAGLAGLEGLAGIPGSVGGVVRMNAGGKYGTISDVIREVRLMAPDGRVETRSGTEMCFAYRRSGVGESIVLAATFLLTPQNSAEVLDRYRRIWNEKHASQPPVSARSAGCIFKNPPGHAAGKLIDDAGLKGTRRGGAEISTQHANFIVAYPGAKTADVLALIDFARQRVRQTAGVELELEVEVW